MRLMAEERRGTEEALLAHGGFEMLQQTTQDPALSPQNDPRSVLIPDSWTPMLTVLGDSARPRRDSESARAGAFAAVRGHVTDSAFAEGKRCGERRDTVAAVPLQMVSRRSAGVGGRFWNFDAEPPGRCWFQRSVPELGAARATLAPRFAATDIDQRICHAIRIDSRSRL